MVSRLLPILQEHISPFKMLSLPNANQLIVQEILTYKSTIGRCVFKLDMEKAYDNIW